MITWWHELVFRIKFWHKKRKLKKLDPYVYRIHTDKKN
jgi:hypothetical protein